MSSLPLIVGYGGINAAGRSIFDFSHQRILFDSITKEKQAEVLQSLGCLMGTDSKEKILQKTLIRTIDEDFFDNHNFRSPKLPTLAGGQLPSGFNPADTYNSRQHPRGLAMTIFGLSDAVMSLGLPWEEILQKVPREKISCVSGCAVAQADKYGMGGMFQAPLADSRITSKHMAMSLGEGSADFGHAYVLGSMGSTGSYTGACATFQYNLKLGISMIQSGESLISVVGASESGIVPEIYEAFSATKGLAEDVNLIKLQEKLGEDCAHPNHRKICRPFGDNIGMSLGESAQFVVLMADNLALELGLNIHGAALSSHIHADGYKKSISGPGAGNYLTVGKAMHEINKHFGEIALSKTFFHAHGTSTPQNRESESHIISSISKAFGIQSLPVTAIKSYLGHSLAAAGGDQMISTLGSWKNNLIPGITSIPKIADNVYSENVSFLLENLEFEDGDFDFAVLNAKGFGGNNGTALVASPTKTMSLLKTKYTSEQLKKYHAENESISNQLLETKNKILQGDIKSRYIFGENVIDGLNNFEVEPNKITNKLNNEKFYLESTLPYKEFF
ncbi:beta-ketoacyl synthase, C-terminal domain protein [SAR86 cluster bacterium SAR86E]|jgi:acetoacetyl-[acyl-carrier protein] synthase|uniref:Beta-ketoacyl synthase, C-terminal domain protein n=1 Tax=SAR86 cluster bacterium SAR86E TaxID=1208365 RepID=K6H3E6_9GAMM|nr:beta-ketoacyl synthase, C-terminal domain protein [SAR86 cluster bacterium SAR86E]